MKVLGIIVAVFMIVFGGIACFAPIIGQAIVIWMMIGGLFIYGVDEIITYCASPKEFRNGFSLASGIIWVVLCIILFVSAVNADAISSFIAIAQFDYFLAIMISFSCIFSAINDFCICGKAEELGRSKGGMIVSGILGILAGLIIMSYPVGSIITLEIFYSIFLFAGGIVLLCRCLSLKTDK